MKKTLNANMMLVILTGLNLFNYLDRYILGAVLTPLKHDLNLSDAQAGRIATVFMLGYFISSPFFGYLGDRLPRKWLIAGGVFVWSLGTVFTGLAPTLGLMLLARVLVGFGEASYGTISPAVISDVFPPQKRNNALTIFYVAIPVGSALGFILGGQIAASYSWREAFIFAGAPGLLLALLWLPFKDPPRGHSDGLTAEEHRIPSWKDVLKLFKISDFNYLCWGYVAYTFAMGAYAHWGPSFLERFHNVDNKTANLFFGGTLVVAGLVGTMIGGFAATAWYKKNKAAYSLVLGISVLLSVPATFAAFMTTNTPLAMGCIAFAMLLLFCRIIPTCNYNFF